MFENQSVIGVLFNSERTHVLLVLRRDVPVWVLPGGGIEKDESPERALVREMHEESGFQVNLVRKVGEYTPINKLAKFTHLFECSLIGGKAAISDESKAVRFFPIQDLPKLLPPPYGEWIEDAYQKSSQLLKKKLTSVNYRTLAKNFLLHPMLVVRFLLSKIGLTINT